MDKASAPEARALGPHLGSGSVFSSIKGEEMVNLWSQSGPFSRLKAVQLR